MCHDGLPGTFELTDPAGLPSGYIDVTLKWKFTYLPPPGLVTTAEQAKFITKEAPIKLATDESGNMNRVEVKEIIPATVRTTTMSRVCKTSLFLLKG